MKIVFLSAHSSHANFCCLFLVKHFFLESGISFTSTRCSRKSLFFGNNSKLFKFRKLVRANLVTAPCFKIKRAWRERAVKVNVLISLLWLLTFLQQRQYWNVRQSKSVELKNVYFLSKKATYLKPVVSINQIYYLALGARLIMLRKGDLLSNFEQASLTQL